MTVSPYLFFKGNCAEAMKFYEKATGGKIDMMMSFGDTPGGGDGHVSADWKDKIMHASIKIGDTWLMASDGTPDFKEDFGGFSVAVEAKTPEEAEKVFKALSAGGTVRMPMAETFWANRFGMLTDKFGVAWMVGNSKQM
jgi:PhnB protein